MKDFELSVLKGLFFNNPGLQSGVEQSRPAFYLPPPNAPVGENRSVGAFTSD